MRFPPDYPFSPPFIRVLRPRFQFLTGHVTLGGSICMQMLTKSGWQPSNDIESILVQVRAEILSDPSARLASHQTNVSYSLEDAKVAFQRMTQKYGW
ncbi:ubiquitin-conjugating enzyme E2 Q2 [Elysia marginata]|uniref:Ubiquitin-conjugating enzyme E2 Q2 n=1 Tax=Elysia marginata TaxID=1093978 RepID=A0AAV4FQ56_9GAST|nr:ubiquitin-conjugating enzyme E2 Q2 [Elysia marginata]